MSRLYTDGGGQRGAGGAASTAGRHGLPGFFGRGTQPVTSLCIGFYRLSLAAGAAPLPVKSVAEHVAIDEHETTAEEIARVGVVVKIHTQRFRHVAEQAGSAHAPLKREDCVGILFKKDAVRRLLARVSYLSAVETWQ